MSEYDDAQAVRIVEEMLSKSWDDLETIECQGYIHFPDVLIRRKANGQTEEEPVTIRIVRGAEMRKCRVKARQMAQADGLDLDRDKDMVEDLEVLCILQRAIRNAKPGKGPDGDYYEPWVGDPLELEKRYDKSCLAQIWAKLEAYTQMVDPRPSAIGPKEALAMVAAVAKARSIAPLHGLGSHAQDFCVVIMARLAMNYLLRKSSSE